MGRKGGKERCCFAFGLTLYELGNAEDREVLGVGLSLVFQVGWFLVYFSSVGCYSPQDVGYMSSFRFQISSFTTTKYTS